MPSGRVILPHPLTLTGTSADDHIDPEGGVGRVRPVIHVGVLSPVTGGFFFGEVLVGVVREVALRGGHVTLVQTLDAGQSGDAFTPSMAEIGRAHV